MNGIGRSHSQSTHRNGGFTLTELLVGTLVGLLLIAGVIQTYAASSTTRRLQDDLAEQTERLRFAIDRMGRDLRLAGHGGATPPVEWVTGRLILRRDDVTTAYFVSGGALRYRREDGGTVTFNNQPLVDGFTALSARFIIGDPSTGNIRDLDTSEVDASILDNVWGVRIRLTTINGLTLESSFALRNALLASTAPVITKTGQDNS